MNDREQTAVANKGTVYLVGSGPGDPGLLTVRARDLLRVADVLVYDQLVGDSILGLTRAGAERIYVGKKAGDHAVPQDRINEILVEQAEKNRIVVRLKGGDPFVFGRGGEEALRLVEAGVPFEVVPGITAAVAVPAYAGIPVTPRGYTATLGFVTGHEDPAKEHSDISWPSLAKGLGTVVFYMGVKNLPTICSQLVKHGRAKDTPVAVIQNGTLGTQRTVTGTLATIAEVAKEAGVRPPAIIVVGEVVGLRGKLGWIEKRPLFGKRIVVTRTRQQASDLTRRLEALGAEVMEFSTIRIDPPADPAPLRRAVNNAPDYDWIVFTSTNGVDSFFRELHIAGLDARHLAGAKVCAIGPATSLRLADFGVSADRMPERFVAESVLDEFESDNLTGKRILLPRADIARDALPGGLAKMGAKVDQVEAYRTVVDDRSAGAVPELMESGKVDMVTFTSSSTVTNFAKLIGDERLSQLRGMIYTASIGPITSETIRAHGLPVDISAEAHTIPGLVDAITAFYAGQSK